jgi:hypothetical protein
MHYPQQAPLGASSPHNPLQIPRRHRASRSFLQAAGSFHGRPHRHSSIWSPSRRIVVRLSLPRRQFWFSSWLCSTASCSRAISSRVGSSVLSPSASCCWQPASPLTSPPVAGFSAAKRSCPAGRASYAERGHFLAGMPFLQRPSLVVLPLVGIIISRPTGGPMPLILPIHRYTRQEVAALRVGGPSGRTLSPKSSNI